MISSQVRRKQYVSPGGVAPVSLGFPFAAATDIVVTTQDGDAAPVTLTLNTHYSIGGTLAQWRAGTGTLVPIAIAAGLTVRAERRTGLQQKYDPAAGIALDHKALGVSLDDTVMRAQDAGGIAMDVEGRALMVPIGENPPSVGSLAGGEGKALGIVDGKLVPVPNDFAAAMQIRADVEAARDDVVGIYPILGAVIPDHDYAPILNGYIALAVALGAREIVLPAGEITIKSRLISWTSGEVQGLRLRGQGMEATKIICDFDSDADTGAFEIYGSGTLYQFARGVALRDFTIVPKEGRSVAFGISIVGAWKPYLRNVRATGFRSANGADGAGLVFPKRPLLGNPDAYASVVGHADFCEFIWNYRGVDILSGQAAAGMVFTGSKLQANDVDGCRCPSVTGIKFYGCAPAFNGQLQVEFVAATTSGSDTIVVSGPVDPNAVPGREVRGPGIPINTVIRSVVGQNIRLCRLGSHNLASPTAVNATATSGAAALKICGGYGVTMDGEYWGETGDISINDCEMDGNATAAAYFRAAQWIEVKASRVISRHLSGIDSSRVHFVFDDARAIRGGNFEGLFHRIDVVLTEQNEDAFSSPVVLYYGNGGPLGSLLGVSVRIRTFTRSTTFAASTTNGSAILTVTTPGTAGFLPGQTVEGPGIPANTTIVSVADDEITMSQNATATASITVTLSVPYSLGTASFLDARYSNKISLAGILQSAVRNQFYARLLPTQGLTTSEVALTANNAATGWATPNSNTTGEITAPHDGAMRFSLYGIVAAADPTDSFTIKIYKNGTVGSDGFDWRARGPGSAGNHAIGFTIDLPCIIGDVFRVTVQSSVARSMFGSWRYVASAV